MSFPYTIKYGDTLTLIAHRHGFSSWRDIYYHADNTGFRIKRPNPDKIYPGDVVTIPKGAPATPPQPVPPILAIPPQPALLSTRFAVIQPGDTDQLMVDERDFFFRVIDLQNTNVPQIYWLGPPGGFQHVRGKAKFGKEGIKQQTPFQVSPGRAITDLACLAYYQTEYKKGHKYMFNRLILQLPQSIPIQVRRPFMPKAGPGPHLRRGQFQLVERPERWIEDTWRS